MMTVATVQPPRASPGAPRPHSRRALSCSSHRSPSAFTACPRQMARPSPSWPVCRRGRAGGGGEWVRGGRRQQLAGGAPGNSWQEGTCSSSSWQVHGLPHLPSGQIGARHSTARSCGSAAAARCLEAQRLGGREGASQHSSHEAVQAGHGGQGAARRRPCLGHPTHTRPQPTAEHQRKLGALRLLRVQPHQARHRRRGSNGGGLGAGGRGRHPAEEGARHLGAAGGGRAGCVAGRHQLHLCRRHYGAAAPGLPPARAPGGGD